MLFDPETEPPISLADARALPWLPKRRRGMTYHLSTLHRWAASGVRGQRLEIVRIGGTAYTSEAALRRFIERLSEPKGAHDAG
jgi:hypothetical protein